MGGHLPPMAYWRPNIGAHPDVAQSPVSEWDAPSPEFALGQSATTPGYNPGTPRADNFSLPGTPRNKDVFDPRTPTYNGPETPGRDNRYFQPSPIVSTYQSPVIANRKQIPPVPGFTYAVDPIIDSVARNDFRMPSDHYSPTPNMMNNTNPFQRGVSPAPTQAFSTVSQWGNLEEETHYANGVLYEGRPKTPSLSSERLVGRINRWLSVVPSKRGGSSSQWALKDHTPNGGTAQHLSPAGYNLIKKLKKKGQDWLETSTVKSGLADITAAKKEYILEYPEKKTKKGTMKENRKLVRLHSKPII
jgi:hypothetical protein